jgi:phenylacetate-coenzyme A ligase PaaK-like adenylate-forming protein
MDLNKYLELEPYSLKDIVKKKYFFSIINQLTNTHYKNSTKYKKLLKYLNYKKSKKIEDLPFIPTNIFKKFEIKSVKDNEIVKVLKSSGTSGSPSKIFLDKFNAQNQRIILGKIVSNILGKNRLPMLIVDKNLIKRPQKSFSARVAAINGFSIFGKDPHFLLNDDGEIDYKNLNKFIDRHHKEKIFIFGFTSFVYENLIKKLDKSKFNKDLSNSILIHGGGWKKMENKKITNVQFKKDFKNKFKIKKIHNYYGLVEQTGSIFFDCEKCGCFITSIFSDVIVRDSNFKVTEDGKSGIIQLLSVLPTSYPGHNLLTEDEGKIIVSNKCECSSKGKRFIVIGRNKESEIRGCSDV